MKARFLPFLLAMTATGYLVVMYVTGARPTSEQFVAFEAVGVIAATPEHVRSVDIATGERRWTLARRGDGWVEGERALPPALAGHLALAVKFLHTARPVREFAAAELAPDDPALGLAQPSPVVTAELDDGSQVTLAFGARNPDGSLQYLRVESPPRIYLMSNFVGEEWSAVIAALEALERPG